MEWDAVSQPGNYGWPYCVGANTPYNDFNFATNTSGPAFDCAGGPVNDSPNNTGLQKLPPAIAADVVADVPEEGDGPDDWICR